jgi:hypothetical protein
MVIKSVDIDQLACSNKLWSHGGTVAKAFARVLMDT